MPGFLGGSSGSSGTGGEITFPKEFIDPVTKLRVSNPENLIDTDFEYGLQPTKWETVELINNTPSFFSKSGDTTIPNIVSISTNNGTREITVLTATDHGLAVGIPINVTGTKSVTADGSYVINSIPNTTTFTYLCKDEQNGNNSIEDLYSSIITGEFFQGSQIRIADAEGVTTDAEAISTLTVKTDSTHGFGLNTPFYFLNLNSTISQEFEASNTAAKSFDSSNSATAQTFDGSNTLSTFNIDWSNSATVGGTTSTITACFVDTDTIRVSHGSETFASQPLGTPLYYNLTVAASSGYFLSNPRGVVFLKTVDALNTPVGQSTFQVSATPDGDVIDIVSNMSGTFQLANQARTFAGNNVSPATQTTITLVSDSPKTFDGANASTSIGTVTSYSGSLINVSAVSAISWYQNAMVRYSTTGSAASGLTNNTTYWVDTFLSAGGTNYSFTIKPTPTGSALTSLSGGSGTQTFQLVGVSTDKEWLHVPNHGLSVGEMVLYSYPESGRFTTVEAAQNYYFVETVADSFNIQLSVTRGGGVKDGSTEARAATSAASIKALTGTNTNGLYWIQLEGRPSAQRIFCIMDSAYDGGGWMLGFNLIAATNAGMPSGTAIWNNTFYTTQGSSFGTGNGLGTNQKTDVYGYHNASQVLFLLHNRSDTSFRGAGRYVLNGATTGRTLWYNMTQGPQNTTASSGRASTYGSGSGVPNTSCRPQTRGGDPFIDARNNGDNLIFFQSAGAGGFWGADGYNRAHITTSAGSGNTSYGHTFAGIGGEHQNSGWNNGFKVAPISPYCDCPGFYGEGNGAGNGINYTDQGQNRISTSCGATNPSCNNLGGGNIIDVGMAVFVK
jgi:hypothetical protein